MNNKKIMKPIIKSLYQYSRNEKIKNLIFDAFSKDWDTRYYVASNPKTPIHILEKLSKDKNSNVRSLVAYNPRIPISALEKLSNDENAYVRSAVTSNKNTPIHILEFLSKDKIYSVSFLALSKIQNGKTGKP